MSNVFRFKAKAELDAEQNVTEFIRMCRDDLTVFGRDLDWDNATWKGVCNFTKMGVKSRGFTTDQILHDDIILFAKAYVRYQQGHNPTKLKNEIKAIRAIEPALIKVKGKADITLVDTLVLDQAAKLARESLGASAYQAGMQLEKLATFLTKAGISRKPLLWKNSIKKEKSSDRLDAKTRAKQAEKLPNEEYLIYMAEMFSNDPENIRDSYAVNTFALLMCAPSRITEVEDLPFDCLHFEKDRHGVEQVGLRFYSGKGYGADIKWVSTAFKDIAITAVKRLRKITKEGRELACWLEDRPDDFYRHPACPKVAEDYPLTADQICLAMGWSFTKGHATSVAFNPGKHKDWLRDLRDSKGAITLRDLNKHIHSQLPQDWPWKNKERGIKYSNALYCMRENEMHGNRGVSPVFPWVPGKSQFTSELTARKGVKWQSVWDRNGYMNADGSRITMNSHQVRHYLNTAAQRGDLGQLDVARWSGRANIDQNNTYNHISDEEHLQKVKGTGIMQAIAGPLGKVKSNMPVTLEDLDAIGEGIAHVTEFGFCVHDFVMAPCQKHRDCLNCSEQVCIKGDEEKLQRLKRQRNGIEKQLSKTKHAEGEGIWGADRWTEHQLKSLERADQLISLLESPDLEDGAVIRLGNDQEFSPLKRAIAAKQKQPKVEHKSETPDFEKMRALMGV